MKIENPSDLPFPEPEFAESWSEWLEYRKQRKFNKYTRIGLGKTFKGLVRDSQGAYKVAIQILEQSIEKNWQGLFPLAKTPTNDGAIKNINGGGKQTGFNSFAAKAERNFESYFARAANS